MAVVAIAAANGAVGAILGGKTLAAAWAPGLLAGTNRALNDWVSAYQKKLDAQERQLQQRLSDTVRDAVAQVNAPDDAKEQGTFHATELIGRHGLKKFEIGELRHHPGRCSDEVLDRARQRDPQGWSSGEPVYRVTEAAIRATYHVLCSHLADNNDVLGAMAAGRALYEEHGKTLRELVEEVQRLHKLMADDAAREGQEAVEAAEEAGRTAARDAMLRWVAAIAGAKGYQVEGRKLFPVFSADQAGGFEGPAPVEATGLCGLVITDGPRRATVVPVSMPMWRHVELQRNAEPDGPWLTQVGVGTDLVTLEKPWGANPAGRLVVPGADVTEPIIERTIETAMNNSLLPR